MDNLTEKDMDLAKRFIDRQLTADELKAVNERIQRDKPFAETLAFHVAMRDTFAATEKTNTKPKAKTKFITSYRYKIIAAAAIIIGVIGLATIIRYNSNSMQTQNEIREVALSEFVKEMKPKTTLGIQQKIDELISVGNYQEAVNLLTADRNKAKEPCKNDLVNYKLGMLLLYQQAKEYTPEAIAPLKCLLDNYPTVYPETAIHLTRAYLWSGKKEMAQQTFLTISTPIPLDLAHLKD